MAEPAAESLICPHCRVPMNRHAEKLVYEEGVDASARHHEGLGECVEEVHSCVACGRTESRRSND
jgi:hypothetical protein